MCWLVDVPGSSHMMENGKKYRVNNLVMVSPMTNFVYIYVCAYVCLRLYIWHGVSLHGIGDYLYKPPTILNIYSMQSMASNLFLAQPIKRRSENEVVSYNGDYIPIHGIYLSLDHL